MTPQPPTPPRPRPLQPRDLAAVLAVARVVAGGGRVLVVNTDPAAGRGVARIAAALARVHPGTGVVWAPRGWVAGLLTNWRAASRGAAAYAQYATRVAAWAEGRGVTPPLVRAARRRVESLVARAAGGAALLPWRASPDLVVALGPAPPAAMTRECLAVGVPLVHLAPLAGAAHGAAVAAEAALALAPGHAPMGRRQPAQN